MESNRLNKDLIKSFEQIKNQEDLLTKEKASKERQEKVQELLALRGRVEWDGDLMKMREGKL